MGTKYTVTAGYSVFYDLEVKTNWLVVALVVFVFNSFRPKYTWVTISKN